MSNAESIVAPNTYVIVTGNEKGGAGKTTTTMHLIASLLELGFKVGSVDTDDRQRSLTRYIENRDKLCREKNVPLALPIHSVVRRSPFADLHEAYADEQKRFCECLATITPQVDFLIIDTPGSDSNLSRVAHSYADTVITPINDSFVDLDVLGHIDEKTLSITKPGVYSELIWEQKIQRARRNKKEIDWVVVRNRLSIVDANNKRRMEEAVEKLSKRIGFRVVPGFSERVIFRELFLLGLTLLDLTKENDWGVNLSLSHVAARQELRNFLKALNLPGVTERLEAQEDGERKIKVVASNEKKTDKPELKTVPSEDQAVMV
jgi:chromosome partitioning protein